MNAGRLFKALSLTAVFLFLESGHAEVKWVNDGFGKAVCKSFSPQGLVVESLNEFPCRVKFGTKPAWVNDGSGKAICKEFSPQGLFVSYLNEFPCRAKFGTKVAWADDGDGSAVCTERTTSGLTITALRAGSCRHLKIPENLKKPESISSRNVVQDTSGGGGSSLSVYSEKYGTFNQYGYKPESVSVPEKNPNPYERQRSDGSMSLLSGSPSLQRGLFPSTSR